MNINSSKFGIQNSICDKKKYLKQDQLRIIQDLSK